MARPPSINAIAAAAGVSRNTVSLAVRNDPRVAPATRDRVLAAAAGLNYRPNLLARAMATGKSRVLGLALPRLDFSYIPRLVEAVQEVAFEQGYGVLSCHHHDDPDRLRAAINYLLDHRVDGVMVHCPVPAAGPAAWDELTRSGVPAVFFGFGHAVLPGLVLDLLPQAAGELAVRQLADLGHRRLGYAGGDGGFFGERRLLGVQAAAADLGVKLVAVYDGVETIAGGRAAGRQFLAARSRPTAVVCFADPVAVGFVQEVSRAGVGVPAEVSVVGVDDLPLADGLLPGLSTFRAPAGEMGRAAAESLIAGGPAVSGRRAFGWEWVGRGSAAAPAS